MTVAVLLVMWAVAGNAPAAHPAAHPASHPAELGPGAGAGPAAPAQAVPAAAEAPAFPLIDDTTYASAVLAPRRGRPLLVTFWSAWCAPCLEELPHLIRAVERRGAGPGAAQAAVLAFVNVDPVSDSKAIAKVLKGRRLRFPAHVAFQVGDVVPEVFIANVDKSWQGEVPFAMLYDAGGRPLPQPTDAEALAIARGAVVTPARNEDQGVKP